MSASLQSFVVGLLLAWSLWVMLGRFLPGTQALLRRGLVRLTSLFGENPLSRWLSRAPLAAGGCGDGCGSCKTGCGTPVAAEQPVKWHQPASSGSCH